MKGKLHKMESGYILSLNGDIDDPYAIVNKELAEDYEWYKLSLKNCQAIEQDSPLQEYVLEVNGEGWDDHLYRGSRKQTEWDVDIVEECLDKNCDGVNKKGDCITTGIPKLDEEGCLILKKL
jgi:hypothetical protein